MVKLKIKLFLLCFLCITLTGCDADNICTTEFNIDYNYVRIVGQWDHEREIYNHYYLFKPDFTWESYYLPSDGSNQYKLVRSGKYIVGDRDEIFMRQYGICGSDESTHQDMYTSDSPSVLFFEDSKLRNNQEDYDDKYIKIKCEFVGLKDNMYFNYVAMKAHTLKETIIGRWNGLSKYKREIINFYADNIWSSSQTLYRYSNIDGKLIDSIMIKKRGIYKVGDEEIFLRHFGSQHWPSESDTLDDIRTSIGTRVLFFADKQLAENHEWTDQLLYYKEK